jgi:hypothetical protein
MKLFLEQGAGEILLSDYTSADSIEIALGVGTLHMEQVATPALAVDVGIGEAKLILASPGSAQARLEIGELSLYLPTDSSYSLQAQVGLGDLGIGTFPAMDLQKWKGMLRLSSHAEAVWGAGTYRLNLRVGVGSLRVEPISRVFKPRL